MKNITMNFKTTIIKISNMLYSTNYGLFHLKTNNNNNIKAIYIEIIAW